MAKFKKKPVIIEAEQWTSNEDHYVKGICRMWTHSQSNTHVHTIHNNQIVFVEDGVIPEPDGIHFYPCKPDIFEATYEAVED